MTDHSTSPANFNMKAVKQNDVSQGEAKERLYQENLFLNSWPYETFEWMKTVDSLKYVEYKMPKCILRAISWLSTLNDLVITFGKTSMHDRVSVVQEGLERNKELF